MTQPLPSVMVIYGFHFCKRTHFYGRKTRAVLGWPATFWNFFPFKKFRGRKTDGNRTVMVLGLGNMVNAIEFPNLAVRFCDESPKQHVQMSTMYCWSSLPPKMCPFTKMKSTNYHHAGKKS